MKKPRFPKLFATCFLFCCGVSLVQGQNSETGDDTFTAILKAENHGLSPESIAEIVQIRQRLGGGTRLEVDESLARLPADPQPAPTTMSEFASVFVCELLDPASSATESERLFFEMINAVSEPTMNLNCLNYMNAEVVYADDENISALRSVARRIDELAAELEEINQFEHADSLRLRATGLRHQARISNRTVDGNSIPMR